MVKLTAISYLYFSPRWLHSSAVSEYHITTTIHIVSDPRLVLFFGLRLNQRLGKQSRRRWSKTPSLLLWRHWNAQNPRSHCLTLLPLKNCAKNLVSWLHAADACAADALFLTYWGRHKMDAISQTTFSNVFPKFSWMKMFKVPLKFHWNLFPRVQLDIPVVRLPPHTWYILYASLDLNELIFLLLRL